MLVRSILAYLAHGETAATILADFPRLTEDDVRAVVAFAAAFASEDLPAPTPAPLRGQRRVIGPLTLLSSWTL